MDNQVIESFVSIQIVASADKSLKCVNHHYNDYINRQFTICMHR